MPVLCGSCTICSSSALLLSLRWVASAAKKEGVEEDLSKYDGERHALCVRGYCTHCTLCAEL